MLTPSSPPAPPSDKKSNRVWLVAIGAIAVLALGISIGAASSSSDSNQGESLTTDAPAGEPEAVPESEAAATLTEFQIWLASKTDEWSDLVAEMTLLAPMVERGDWAGAAELSGEVGQRYLDLYLAAPEDGTELSNVTNEMLLTCAMAYMDAETGIRAFDTDMIEEAVTSIGECSDLMADSRALIPG
jgi:hypothetical protein